MHWLRFRGVFVDASARFRGVFVRMHWLRFRRVSARMNWLGFCRVFEVVLRSGGKGHLEEKR